MPVKEYEYGGVPPDAAADTRVTVAPSSIVTMEFGETMFAGTRAGSTVIGDVCALTESTELDAITLNVKMHPESRELGVNANESDAGRGAGTGHPPDTVDDHP